MAPRDVNDHAAIGREGVRLLVETGYYARQDREAAQARKEAERRWKQAGRTLKKIRKGR